MPLGYRHTEEAKEKIRAANLGEKSHFYGKRGEQCINYGRHPTEETRKRLSLSKSGENHPWFGKHHTPEELAKISKGNKGKAVSQETRDKMSKIARDRKNNPMFGRHHSPVTRAKISKAVSGENGGHWKGGISFEPYCPKFNADLKRRIRAFFDHRCIICGKGATDNGQNVGCHHVEYNKQACCDGKPVHFATLCRSCHSITNFDRERWQSMLHIIIYEVYDGKSYFTKEEWHGLQKGANG